MDPNVYSTIETLRNEAIVIKRKLESKCEALLILTKELDNCQSERDQFKMMAEQVQERYQALRKSLAQGEAKMALVDERRTKLTAQQLHCLLHESREANKTLQFEVEELKGKLSEAQGDIRLLRGQLARQRVGAQEERGIATRHFPAHEREELVKQLEDSRDKFQQLERDLEQCLDEKEELVTERDVFKDKLDRLNHELNYILKGDEKKIVDIDALVMENKYLQDRLKLMEEEKSSAMAAASKYKSILERKKYKLPFNGSQSRPGSLMITQKEVRNLLSSNSQLSTTPKTLSDLQGLSRALLETVNDKNLALSHQRKTNKILGTRVAELEKKLKTLEISGLWNTVREHLGEDASNILERLKTECDEVKTAISADTVTGLVSGIGQSDGGKDEESSESDDELQLIQSMKSTNILDHELDLLPCREVEEDKAVQGVSQTASLNDTVADTLLADPDFLSNLELVPSPSHKPPQSNGDAPPPRCLSPPSYTQHLATLRLSPGDLNTGVTSSQFRSLDASAGCQESAIMTSLGGVEKLDSCDEGEW